MKERILYILVRKKKYRDCDYSQALLAEELGVSVFTLSRTLRQTFDMTYTELVHKQRIRDAKRHLRNPKKANYSVDDIGILVGFRNRQSFFTAFKKETGMTPEKFRVMHDAL